MKGSLNIFDNVLGLSAAAHKYGIENVVYYSCNNCGVFTVGNKKILEKKKSYKENLCNKCYKLKIIKTILEYK